MVNKVKYKYLTNVNLHFCNILMSTKKREKRKYRFLRRALRVFLGVVVFLLLLVLFVRSSWGQSIIVQKGVNYVSEKTKTKVVVEKLFLTFNGNLQLEGLYLEDKKGDTLIYSKSLEANLPLWSIIRGDAIGVDDLKWKGLRANIIRKDTVSSYNFQFLIDAFTSKKTNSVEDKSTSEPLDIIIGNLNLEDIDVDFKDDVLGIDSKFKIGSLDASMESLNLEKMIFKTHDISLSDADVKFIQNPITIALPVEELPLPTFSAESITIKNTKAYYKSEVDNILADANIKDFYTEIPELNLKNKTFNLNKIRLKNSAILMKMKTVENKVVSSSTNTTNVIWPEIAIKINDLNLENNNIKYFVNGAIVQKNVFNPNAISLQNLNLKVTDVYLKDQKGSLELKKFNFTEQSGIHLNSFSLNAEITDKNFEVSNFDIAINKNKITGFARADYLSLSQLISSPEKTNVQLKISSFKLWLEEVFRFQPNLKKQEYLRKLSAKKITGNLNLKGSLADVKILGTNINWGNSTAVSLNGTIKNVTKPVKLQLNLTRFKAETKRTDLLQIVDEKQLNIHLPEEILVTGSANGTLKNISLDGKITTTQGVARIKGGFKNKDILNYNLVLNVEDYNVGELLMNPKLGNLSLTVNSEGSGKALII